MNPLTVPAGMSGEMFGGQEAKSILQKQPLGLRPGQLVTRGTLSHRCARSSQPGTWQQRHAPLSRRIAADNPDGCPGTTRLSTMIWEENDVLHQLPIFVLRVLRNETLMECRRGAECSATIYQIVPVPLRRGGKIGARIKRCLETHHFSVHAWLTATQHK